MDDDVDGRELVGDQIRRALGILTPIEKEVLELRFGINDRRSRTLEETGRQLNLDREQVRRIEAEALKKIQSWEENE